MIQILNNIPMKKVARMLGSLVLGIVGAFLLGVFGLVIFVSYGGNACNISYVGNDMVRVGSCECFCCHWFNLQGYEPCGLFGFWLGAALGVPLLVWIVYRLVKFGKR